MRIVEISYHECEELINHASVGRLACALDNKPYVVPVCFAYEPECVYVFSTVGKKIDWMRQNPKVCLQVDEIGNRSNWTSVVVEGTYFELREPLYVAEKEHAKKRLAHSGTWWEAPMAERRERTTDLSIQPVFFRINIQFMSGLRAMSEAG